MLDKRSFPRYDLEMNRTSNRSASTFLMVTALIGMANAFVALATDISSDIMNWVGGVGGGVALSVSIVAVWKVQRDWRLVWFVISAVLSAFLVFTAATAGDQDSGGVLLYFLGGNFWLLVAGLAAHSTSTPEGRSGSTRRQAR